MFLEFHIEGEYLEFFKLLRQNNIMFKTFPPFSEKGFKSINIAIEKEEYPRFSDFFFSYNKKQKEEGKNILVIWRNKESHCDFIKLYLEGDNLTIFGELSKKKIPYLLKTAHSYFNSETGAVNILIPKKYLVSVLEIIYQKNLQIYQKNQRNKVKELVIQTYMQEKGFWVSLNIQEILEKCKEYKQENKNMESIFEQQINIELEKWIENPQPIKENLPVFRKPPENKIYFFTYLDTYRIIYNTKNRVVHIVNSITKENISFLKDNPNTELEQEIVEFLNLSLGTKKENFNLGRKRIQEAQ